MEITPVPATSRTRKVQPAKAAAPKSGKLLPSKKPAPVIEAPKPKAVKVSAKPAHLKAKPAKPRASRKTLVSSPPPDLTPMIATAAYYLAQRRNFVPGHEWQDWLQAEQQIRACAA